MAEQRLIDANALLESKWWDSLKDEFDKARVKIIVQSCLSVDAVPVVRCKDCIYWDGMGYEGRCEPHKNGLIREYTNYDDFCSYGERRTDNG